VQDSSTIVRGDRQYFLQQAEAASLVSYQALRGLRDGRPPAELVKNADMIIRALQSESARRLLTPFTVWAYLNHLLQDRSIISVMTLGGHKESRLWISGGSSSATVSTSSTTRRFAA